jgi:cytochrome b561
MEEEHDNYADKIKILSGKVNDITNTKKSEFSIPIFIPKNIKPIHIYIGIPVLFLIILLIFKPYFITSEVKNNETFFIERKLSIVKLITIEILFIVVIVIVYFINNVNTKPKEE